MTYQNELLNGTIENIDNMLCHGLRLYYKRVEQHPHSQLFRGMLDAYYFSAYELIDCWNGTVQDIWECACSEMVYSYDEMKRCKLEGDEPMYKYNLGLNKGCKQIAEYLEFQLDRYVNESDPFETIDNLYSTIGLENFNII